jgi:hypothetical protein
MHALRLPGTHHCVTRDINDTLDCLGGIKVLFPLFVQLDNPVKLPHTGVLSHEVDPEFLTNLLKILTGMIRSNSANQQFMQNEQGFGVISHLLNHLSPENLTVATLNAMVALVASVEYHSQFYRHALLTLLFNVENWIYAAAPVRAAWSAKLLNLISNRPALFREHFLGVQRVLDALRTVCWFQNAQGTRLDTGRLANRLRCDNFRSFIRSVSFHVCFHLSLFHHMSLL